MEKRHGSSSHQGKKVRILILTSSYLPIFGGVQSVVHNLAKELLRNGHEVQVVTNRYPHTLPKEEKTDGVLVQRFLFLRPSFDYFKNGRFDLWAASFWFPPLTLLALIRFFEKFEPKVVNMHFPDAQIPFVLELRKRFKFRLIVSLHGHEVERFFEKKSGNKKQANLLRKILRDADHVTACSRYLMEKAIELEPSIKIKGKVIYNGINLERFCDQSAHQHPRLYILAYGRMVYKKGFDLLIDAFKQVGEKHTGIDLIVAGEGEEEQNLQTSVKRLGLDKRVHFYGKATQEQVATLLNGCEFVVVPSRQEPFGIVALEAMAAGKRILATHVGGLPEFIESPPNLLVEPTVDGLTKGLRKFLSESCLMIIPKNLEKARGFSLEKMGKQYLKVFFPLKDQPLSEAIDASHSI